MNLNMCATKKVAALCLVSLFAYAPQADAQGLLKGLADKAAKKVGDKVEKKLGGTKVGSAISTVRTLANGASTTSGGESVASDAGYAQVPDEYPEFLAPSADGQDYWSFEAEEMNIPTLSFTTWADARKAWPAVPTAAQLQDEAAMRKFYTDYMAFQKGLEQMAARRTMQSAELGMAMRAMGPGVVGHQVSAEQRAYVDRMMAAVMQLPAAERDKIEAMAENDENGEKTLVYLKAHHPDLYKTIMTAPSKVQPVNDNEERLNQYSDIMDKVQVLNDKTAARYEAMTQISMASLMSGEATSMMQGPGAELTKLRQEIVADWVKSEECAQVKAMEEALNKRWAEWEKANPQYDKFAAQPPFWTEEREKQNAVIDSFNKKVAERWAECIKKLVEAEMADFDLLAEQDARLAALGMNGDDEKAMYYMASSTINTASMTLHQGCLAYPAEAFAVPFVSHTESQVAGQ